MTSGQERTGLTEIEINVIVMKSVRETLTSLGIDLSDARALRDVQADFAYMRRQRIGAENISEWIKKAIITTFVGAALFMIWQGIKMALTVKGGP